MTGRDDGQQVRVIVECPPPLPLHPCRLPDAGIRTTPEGLMLLLDILTNGTPDDGGEE